MSLYSVSVKIRSRIVVKMIAEKPSWIRHEGMQIFSIDIQPGGLRFATGGGDHKVLLFQSLPYILVLYCLPSLPFAQFVGLAKKLVLLTSQLLDIV